MTRLDEAKRWCEEPPKLTISIYFKTCYYHVLIWYKKNHDHNTKKNELKDHLITPSQIKFMLHNKWNLSATIMLKCPKEDRVLSRKNVKEYDLNLWQYLHTESTENSQI